MNKTLIEFLNRIVVKKDALLVQHYNRMNYHPHIAMFHDIIEDSVWTDDEFACRVSDLKDYVQNCVGGVRVCLNKITP